MTTDQTVEQAIRKQHCARKDEIHECAGTCKITPEGIELSCPLCGSDRQPFVPETINLRHSISQLSLIFKSAGLDLDKFSASAQLAALKVFCQSNCRGCGQYHVMFNDYLTCSCGWRWRSGRGWEK